LARTKARGLKQQIEAARVLAAAPQTLALPTALGGKPHSSPTPEVREAVARVAEAADADRAKAWAEVRGQSSARTRPPGG
jgi:hypothetical protein